MVVFTFPDATQTWLANELSAQDHALTADGKIRPARGIASAAAWLCQSSGARQQAMHLVTAPDSGVRVDGEPVLLGIKRLANQSCISPPKGAPLYFSSERLLAVEPFPGAERKVFCPRCKQAIEKETPAVRCECDYWHHQSDDLPCFTYDEQCDVCSTKTSRLHEGAYSWTPDSL